MADLGCAHKALLGLGVLNPNFLTSHNLFAFIFRLCLVCRILADLGCAPDVMTLTPKYGPCEAESLKGRMMRAVASLGADEVRRRAAGCGLVHHCGTQQAVDGQWHCLGLTKCEDGQAVGCYSSVVHSWQSMVSGDAWG